MGRRSTRMRWTYWEFARLPSAGSTRHEVIDGELAVTPAPTAWHQIVLGRLVGRLGNFIEDHDLGILFPGPIDVLFGEGDYLEPDLAFVRRDRSDLVSERGLEGPPDLIVEIVSPSTEHRDRGIKLERYRHFGVPEYWIVDAGAKSIEVWRLGEGAETPEVSSEEDRLGWTPLPGGPTLEVSVVEVCETVA
jgi:Uma2 family endonuclease